MKSSDIGDWLICGGSFASGVFTTLFMNWLFFDVRSISPFALLLLMVVSPFWIAMGYAARRELDDARKP